MSNFLQEAWRLHCVEGGSQDLRNREECSDGMTCYEKILVGSLMLVLRQKGIAQNSFEGGG